MHTIPVWEINDPDGKSIGWMTIREEVAKKACEARAGRTMKQVMVEVDDYQNEEYQAYLKRKAGDTSGHRVPEAPSVETPKDR